MMPSVSIVVPTYNEERNISVCLDAIAKQDYPQNRIEILIVDNYSTDKTVKKIKDYPNARVLYNKVKDPEISKMIGLQNSKGEFFLYLDADVEIVGENWLSKLLMPLIDNPTAAGSFPRFIPDKNAPPLARFLRYHPLELDPIFQFFCTEIMDTVVSEENDYWVCRFVPQKVPPIGICIYRKDILIQCIGRMKKFMDIDVPVILSENGFNEFIHVPSCGIYHRSSFSLREIANKRIRNIRKVYLPNLEKRRFKYFDLSRKKDLLKIFFWVVYANLFFPEFIRGVYKTIENRDTACMYEPVIAIVLTDVIVYGFLRYGLLKQIRF